MYPFDHCFYYELVFVGLRPTPHQGAALDPPGGAPLDPQ